MRTVVCSSNELREECRWCTLARGTEMSPPAHSPVHLFCSQVGAVLGELVAAGGADLKVVAVHIRTADANPDEIQVRPAGWRGRSWRAAGAACFCTAQA